MDWNIPLRTMNPGKIPEPVFVIMRTTFDVLIFLKMTWWLSGMRVTNATGITVILPSLPAAVQQGWLQT